MSTFHINILIIVTIITIIFSIIINIIMFHYSYLYLSCDVPEANKNINKYIKYIYIYIISYRYLIKSCKSHNYFSKVKT